MLMNQDYLDRFNGRIVLSEKFILYRDRSIPYSEIKEIRVKGNRFLINHFNTNTSHPKMCIQFVEKDKATWFHDEIISKMYFP
jgi:hypothetical protein